jgi:MarR family 2-MHQ and catechol resistance regulon transcriptional repressor
MANGCPVPADTSHEPVAGGLTLAAQLLRILSIVKAAGEASPDVDTDLDRTATLQLVIALARAYQAIEQGVRPHLAEQGLGMTEFAVLEVLYHKGPLPLGEIRDRILVTGASTTYVVKKLEQRGLIRRKTCAEDQRIVFGELTPKGRRLIDEVFPAHVARLRRVMAGLSVSEKRGAGRLLRRLSQHARHTTGERITEDD